MTAWTATVGEILNVSAQGLICSANPQLNLSGGIGGAFRMLYGPSMQQFLHQWLSTNNRHFVEPGNGVVAPSCGSPFDAIAHAVAIDAFYDTSESIIRTAYDNAFAALADRGCQTVTASCLACGYGRATPQMFVTAVSPFFTRSLRQIERVQFVSTNAELIDLLCETIDSK